MHAAAKLRLVQPSEPDREWQAAAHEAVDQLIREIEDETMGMQLDELSDLLRKKGQRVTGAVLSGVLKSRIADGNLETLPCPSCNKTLKSRGQRKRTIITRHGGIEIERPYFYCTDCRRGIYPTDEDLGIVSHSPTQLDIEKAAAKLLQRLPYEEASEVFEDLTGTPLSDHAMHGLADRLGEATAISDVLPSKQAVEAAIAEGGKGKIWRPIVVVAADGADVPLRPMAGKRAGKRGNGYWKEAKGFRIYMICQDRIVQLMSWHQIANEEEFGHAIRFASTLIPRKTVRVALLGDGAPWIWKHLKAAFPGGKQILDYYHCSEHIHKVASLQYARDEDQQALWIESTMARLFYGNVGAVMWGLERMNPSGPEAAIEIRNLITYLGNNEDRIDYRRAKRGQYPLGSGGIESANKFICHKRMKLSGAWWYEINGNAMLRLRCAVYNGTFDQVFAKYKQSRISGENA